MSETEKHNRDPLERQLQILELLVSYPQGRSFTDIGNVLNLPKASTSRLLKTLVSAGCVQVEKNESAGTSALYVLGDRIRGLLRGIMDPDQTVTIAHSVLNELAKEANETAFLSVLRGDKVENLVMASPAKNAHGYVNPGRVVPAHAAAAAKAIFAYQPETVWNRVLRQPLPALTDKTITDPEKVREEYLRVRDKGIAYCREEIDSGLMAIAAPVHLKEVGVIYAVSIVGPSSRIRNLAGESLDGMLKKAADQLSAAFERVMLSA